MNSRSKTVLKYIDKSSGNSLGYGKDISFLVKEGYVTGEESVGEPGLYRKMVLTEKGKAALRPWLRFGFKLRKLPSISCQDRVAQGVGVVELAL